MPVQWRGFEPIILPATTLGHSRTNARQLARPMASGVEMPFATHVEPEEFARRDAFRALPTATPPTISIGSLPHPALRLREPIVVDVIREGATFGVWSEDLEELGYGPHLTAAIEDFQQTLIETYITLRDDHDRLGPGLVALWSTLRRFTEERA